MPAVSIPPVRSESCLNWWLWWLGRPRTCASYSSIVGESLRYRCGSCASDVSWRCTCWTILWLVRVLCILLSRCGATVRPQMLNFAAAHLPPSQSSNPPSWTLHSPSSSPFQSGVSVLAYLMVLSVFRRIHWGMGLFCFWALASFCLVRNDLWDCRSVSTACSRHAGVVQSWGRIRTGILTVLSGCLCGCSVGSRLVAVAERLLPNSKVEGANAGCVVRPEKHARQDCDLKSRVSQICSCGAGVLRCRCLAGWTKTLEEAIQREHSNDLNPENIGYGVTQEIRQYLKYCILQDTVRNR